MPTMFGWCSLPAARASLRKRPMNCSARSESMRSLRTVLMATVRSMCGSTALYTTPMAPLPRTPTTSYLPSRAGSVIVVSCAGRRGACSRLEHLHGLHDAGLHAAEGLGQHADL